MKIMRKKNRIQVLYEVIWLWAAIILLLMTIIVEEATATTETETNEIKPELLGDDGSNDINDANQVLSDLLAAFASGKILAIGQVNQSSLMVVTNGGTADRSMVHQIWPSSTDSDGSDSASKWNLWNATTASVRSRWPQLPAAMPKLDACLAMIGNGSMTQGFLVQTTDHSGASSMKLMLICDFFLPSDGPIQPVLQVTQVEVDLQVAGGGGGAVAIHNYTMTSKIGLNARFSLLSSISAPGVLYCLQREYNTNRTILFQMQVESSSSSPMVYGDFSLTKFGLLCADNGGVGGGGDRVVYVPPGSACAPTTNFAWLNRGFAVATDRRFYLFGTQDLYTLPIDGMPAWNSTLQVTAIPLREYFTVKYPPTTTTTTLVPTSNANMTTERSNNNDDATDDVTTDEHSATKGSSSGRFSLIFIAAPVGVVCLLLVLGGLYYYFFCCNKHRKKSSSDTTAAEDKSSVNTYKDSSLKGKTMIKDNNNNKGKATSKILKGGRGGGKDLKQLSGKKQVKGKVKQTKQAKPSTSLVSKV